MAEKVTFNGEILFPNEYLAAADLKGKDVTITITSVTREMLKKKGGKDKKETILRFAKTTKKLVCNKTNAGSIAVLHGAKAEKWPGKMITVYPTRCLAFGEMVDCIRIRENKPRQTEAIVNPPSEMSGPTDDQFGGAPEMEPDQTFEPDSSQLMVKDEDTIGDGSNPEPTLDRLPSTLPDEARKDLNWLTKHVLGSNRPAGATTVVQTLKAFKAKLGVNSWEKLSPSQQDGIYTALMTDSFWS